MREPLAHAAALAEQIGRLSNDPRLCAASRDGFRQKAEQIGVILADYAAEQQRMVPTPAVMVEDESAFEVARIFEVQGQFVAAIRWNPNGGEGYWGSAAYALAGAVGSCAAQKIEADPDDITESILNAAIDEFEQGVNPVVEHDPTSHRPLN